MSIAFLAPAIAARQPLIDGEHQTAFRLFNGFSEGLPTLSLDVYQKCLLVHDYGDSALADQAITIAREQLPWLTTAVLKVREGNPDERNGRLVYGDQRELPDRVYENGVWYALNLLLNRDASFYLDTRNLRAWAKTHLAKKRVLNTFAYTGSLGVAARAAQSRQVITTDANKHFLAEAKRSFQLNKFPIDSRDFRAADFFDAAARLKRENELFDCVFLDPPFFAKNDRGQVDLQNGMGSLINKVRPLVGHEGWLVLVNNAVFVSGAEYHTLLTDLCAGGYLTLDTLIEVPEDCRGYLPQGAPAVDPAPFTHATKIAILKATRKDGRRA